jgi:NAD(P)-dependent dehydrogenase (short-subunit alcohol dehydrogenase family)
MAMHELLKGQLALVTGGGKGIGAGVAQGLAAHGATVIVVGTTLASLNETVAAIEGAGGRAHAYVVDVSDLAACKGLAEQVGRECGNVSILVNNAGVIRYASMESDEVERAWDEVVQTNLSGAFHMARAFLPQLKATRGCIVNLSSIAAFIYTSNTVAYSASKGGIRSLTVALARELGPHGIRVNAVAPGAVATRMSPSAGDEQRMAALARRVPLGRIGQPEDIAGPVVFLASPMAAYVTGTTLVVDGGYLTN